jgi:hypothetical protein
MNTLIKSILLTGAVLFSQASFALYFDGGLGNANVDAGAADDDDIYLKFGVGDGINRNLNWEAGYWNVGTDAGVNGFFGDLKLFTGINSDTQLFGKVGLYMWDADGNNDGTDMFFGGGVTFLKMGPGNLNLELLMGDLEDWDLTTIGASYSIPFGK